MGLAACGASHHWARALAGLGHEVKLVAPQHVKAYVRRSKHDAADAEAGCEAMSRPRTWFVPVKSAEDQAALMLVAVRERLVRARTQVWNTIRGHAAKFGLVSTLGLDSSARCWRASPPRRPCRRWRASCSPNSAASKRASAPSSTGSMRSSGPGTRPTP